MTRDNPRTSAADRFAQLQQKIKTHQQLSDRAAGAIAEHMKALADLGCQSIKQAQAIIDKLDAEIAATENKVNKLLTTFENQWRGFLDENA